MTEKRFNVFDVDGTVFLEDHKEGSYHIGEKENVDIPCLNDIADRLNTYADENEQLKSDLKDCKKLKGKRLKKIRNHRAVIEELGGVIKAYKGKLSQANEKIEKIKEAMEDTGALTKRQLKEILND